MAEEGSLEERIISVEEIALKGVYRKDIMMSCTIMPPVDSMSTITIYVLTTLNIITAVSSVLINICFMAAIFINKSLMTPTNILIASLSLSDFLVGLVTQPLFIIHLLANKNEVKNCMLAYCSFTTLGIFCGASGMCLPFISLDRCVRMAKLTHYRLYVTRKRVLLIICIIWMNAFIVAFLPFYGIRQSVFYAMLIGFLCLNSLIMLASYIYVVRKSRNKLTEVRPKGTILVNTSKTGLPSTSGAIKSRQITELSRQMHVTITVTLLIAIVIFSWLPVFIVSLIWTLGVPSSNKNEAIVTLHYTSLTVGFAVSTVNPLLYCWRISDVRKAALKVLRKFIKCIP